MYTFTSNITNNDQQRTGLIHNVETITTYYVRNLSGHSGEVTHVNNVLLNNKLWRMDGTLIDLQKLKFLQVNSCLNRRPRYRKRIAIILYVLSEIHRMLLTNDTCTIRELYYKNTKLVSNQRNINTALIDICTIFHTLPWTFGIFSSGKGLIAGPLKMYLKNGDIVDYNNIGYEMVLQPKAVHAIDHLETTANFIVVVEKDTVFQKFVTQMFADGDDNNTLNMILITGKGFPDLCTRALLHRLSIESSLPIYILVDADPCGINIMQIYRSGSKAMSEFSEKLICPRLKWLGVHPSELETLDIPTRPLTTMDYKRIANVQQHEHLPDSVKKELLLLQQLQRKSHIEALPSRFLLNDYVINKIKRNLTL